MINSLNYQQMAATGASSGGVSFGSGYQYGGATQSAEEINIFAGGTDNTSSINGLSSITSGYQGGVNASAGAGENYGLVERLDAMDQSALKPEYQDEYRANNIDFYA